MDITYYQAKKKMAVEVGQVLGSIGHGCRVAKIDYDVFEDRFGHLREYLVITYHSGAIAARNCQGDSIEAVFTEIAKLIYGGYYEEVDSYYALKQDSKPVL